MKPKCGRTGCGKPVKQARHQYCSAKCGQLAGRAAPQGDSVKYAGDAAHITKTVPDDVRSLDDLIRVCKIDTDLWHVDHYSCNKWDWAGGTCYQVKAVIKRRSLIIGVREEIADLVAAAKKAMPTFPRLKAVKPTGNMLEIAIPDLHFGKFAWGKETGWPDYDAKIAEAAFDDALSALLARTASYSFERILFVVGNDLFHADNKANTTTAGTQLEVDSRYHKTFVAVRRMICRAIERLSTIAPVVVPLVSGNHDTLSVWHLGDSLECYFDGRKNIEIQNQPTLRKYHQFGKVMLMFTHGDKGKSMDYPLLMATEQPAMFGETLHREAHTAHRHKTDVSEHHGVKVRISPALCPPDAWHSEHQFVGNAQAAEAFIWNKTEGLIGTAIYTVPPLKKAA